MAFGITVAMILAAMDLSQYTVAAVSGMVMALMLRAGAAHGVAIVCALLTGVLLGLLNGVLVSICGVNPIIATLGHAADLPRLCLSGLQRQEHSHQQ